MKTSDLDAEQLNTLLGDGHDDAGREAVVADLAHLLADMRANGGGRDEPMREIFARLGDRWSVLILILLKTTPLRHAALRRLIAATSAEGAISQRMLTLRLRGLERDGLVARTIEPSVPPRVTYALTDLGRDLFSRIDALMDWVRGHNAHIRAARDRFDTAAID